MSLNLKPATSRRVKNAVSPGIFTFKGIVRMTRLIFISGPWMLLTSRLSGKNASLMILLCLPALLFCAMLIVPGIIFTLPEQNAYYEFAKVLNQDPTRWIILTANGFCTLLSLAVPATAPREFMAIRY